MSGPGTPVMIIGTILSGPTRVTVDSTAGGKTLSGLGITIDPSIQEIALIPASSGIYWAKGAAASATGPWLPPGGMAFSCERSAAESLKFYAATNTDMVVIQVG